MPKKKSSRASTPPQVPVEAIEPFPELAALRPIFNDRVLRKLLPMIALIILAFGFYSPALRGVYIWDDPDWLTNSPVIRQPGMFHYIWTEPQATPQYYPLIFTTFWLEYRVFGGLGPVGPDGVIRGVGYHVDNLLLHALSAMLIFQILKRLKLPGGNFGAWLSAAVFVIHPVNVESVAWVVERKNCLCGVFFFSALLFGLRFFDVTFYAKRASPARRWIFYALALVLFIAAMLSKTIAAVLPPVFLLMIWFRRGKISIKEILLSAPFFLISIGMGAMTAYFEVSHAGTTGPEWNFSIVQRFLIAGSALWFYIWKLLVPYPLMQVYPRFDIVAGQTVTNPLYYVAPVAFLALVAGLFLLRKRITRGPVTAVLFFAGVALPALGFINFYTMVFTFVADHYQYLACVGIIVLVVETLLWALRFTAGKLAATKPDSAVQSLRIYYSLGGALSLGILLALGVLAYGVSELYTDGEALWGFNIVHNPTSFVPFENMASVRLNKAPKDFRGAEVMLKAAIKVGPNDWRGYHALGTLYLDVNRPDKALALLTKAESLMPEVVRKNRAKFFEARAHAGAVADSSMQDKRFMTTYGPHYTVAQHFEQNREWNKAIAEYLIDHHDYPQNVDTDFNLGNCYVALGDLRTAATWFRLAVQVNPKLAKGWLSLGLCLYKLNQPQQAESAVLKARDLDLNVVLLYPELAEQLAQQLRAPATHQ